MINIRVCPKCASIRTHIQDYDIIEINGLTKNQTSKYYSNSVAESINNSVSTITKVSNGYKDFERFRKRCMLISRYKKI